MISSISNSKTATVRELRSEASIDMLMPVLEEALLRGASDIHFEPCAEGTLVRLRKDGVLQTLRHLPRGQHEALVNRLKILASLDIAEKRFPQDGQFSFTSRTLSADMRLSTLPTKRGEDVHLRLLGRQQTFQTLDDLGLNAAVRDTLQRMLAQPHGLILWTGPNGSGKTTTLYAALRHLLAQERKIITIEDPVEYDLEGLTQTQIHPDIGLTFAEALRCVLRHNPDVIMIGEIRDAETASIAVQAALTGHLVLSTLHTESALAAIPRLLDMGVPAYLLSSALLAVGAQRLVRRWNAETKDFDGRVPLTEMIAVEDTLKSLIPQHLPLSVLKEKTPLRTLFDDGLARVEEGITTLDEVRRVTAL